jgi:hypothetical protein
LASQETVDIIKRMSRSKPLFFVFAWLVVGMAMTRSEEPSPFSAEDRAYWAFQPIKRPNAPTVRQRDWVRNTIDAFILAKLEAAGLSPAAEADRRTLIRRACFDLHGLPPTPRQVEQFVNDTSPEAYERLIDRLLASPRYGERWARHWLDLVRYAESDGYNQDAERPHAWRYRDYVIRAFNDDKPYDRFIAEQVAGDEYFPGDHEALVATGFLRHGPYEFNQRDVPQQRMHILNDITDVAGHVFLGLTLRCARCHDHKFDPLLQQDYFRLQAFFTPLVARDDVPLASAAEIAAHGQQLERWKAATREVREAIAKLEEPYRKIELKHKKEVFPRETQAIVDKPSGERTPWEEQIAAIASRQFYVTKEELLKHIKGEERKRWDELQKELATFDALAPKPLPMAMAASDVGPVAPPTFVPESGALDDPSSHVTPGFLTIVDPAPAQAAPSAHSTGRRKELACWLTTRGNPLVSRVMVNRLWHYHFRGGLVGTPNDFGRQGDKCTHPELLDWLAVEFMDRGWSLKHMHRLMMTSATYRQASPAPSSAQAAQLDPNNKLLWRMRGGRLEAEAIRDAILAVCGDLNLKSSGPSVYPELPDAMSARHGWAATKEAAERNRRAVFMFVKRNLVHPLLESFDMPDGHESCARRQVTTTAPQALILLNGDWALDRAAAFAGRLRRDCGDDRYAQIRRAYQLAYSRSATDGEVSTTVTFLERQAGLIGDSSGSTEFAALVDFCHAILNSNELIYVD